MYTITSQMEAHGSYKASFRGSGNRLIMVSAFFLSVIGLIVLNATVLHYFFGNLSRTSTHHLLKKTEMYDLELVMNVTIDEVAKDAERLVNQRGFDLDREIQGKFSTFNGLLDDLKTEFDSEIISLKETIANQDLTELKEQLSKLQEGVEELDVNKPNVSFVFESDITELLEELKNEKRTFAKYYKSKFFFCRGIPWSLSYSSRLDTDHLSVYLQPYNLERKRSEETRWEIKTKYKVAVLNQAGKDHQVSEELIRTFSNEKWGGAGFPRLILLEDLERGGFMKNNKIQLKIELIAGKLNRNVL